VREALTRGVILAVAVGPVLAYGCAPGGTGPPSPAAVSPATPKILTIGSTREPPFIVGFTGGGTTGGSGFVGNIPHNTLTVLDEQGVRAPQLAAQVPSVQDGTWQVNPDGTMEVTWKLRPNTRWQDGAPFTSADLAFTLGVVKDPGLPTPGVALGLIESATAVDPLTFVIRWREPYAMADSDAFDLLPRHLLEELYLRGDNEAFVNSPFLSTEFVGLGPYRLERWVQGSQIDFTRFDEYVLGRPALDRVIVRFIGEQSALVASILAGAVDIVYPPGADFDTAVNVKERWAGTNNTVRFDAVDPAGRLRMLEIQYRPEHAQPKDGLTNPQVRRALYQGLDLQSFVEVVSHGLAPMADSWIPPFDARRPSLEASIPRYAYDPARAQQLLAEAGWIRGADGVLIGPGGERFELQLRATQVGGAQVGKQLELSVVGDAWKRLGVEPTLNLQAIGTAGDRGYEAVQPGIADVGNVAPGTNLLRRLNSRFIATEANRWTGNNLSGFRDPQVDALLDRYYVTLDSRERLDLDRQLLVKILGDLVVMPLYWEVVPTLMLGGVDASLASPLTIYKIYQWTKA
jgi:peptide/nickel transport system substrate-binding protein